MIGAAAKSAASLFGKVKSLNSAKIGRGASQAVFGSDSLGAALRDPKIGIPAAGLGAMGLGHLVIGPTARGIRDSAGSRGRSAEQLRLEREAMLQERGWEMEIQRMERAMSQNAARLAAVNPHLYNTVMAGRRLPKGAVVLGGQPRTDLLEELARRMANGEYQSTDPLEGLV